MVKADIKRNYYADLELPNDASVEDIKKAYRKLALKYHPDRNPGKESEIVPKFQAIQAAHEILHDPTSKARYDADRRKAGLGGGAFTKPNVPPRSTGTNPMYQATSAYPPPPRRTPNPTASWRSTTSGSSGADRFTNFPKPAPTSKKNTADPSNVFNAWQNMKSQTSGSSQQPRESPQRPKPAPPPRRDTRFPTEEDIRAGMNYRQPPSNGYGGFRSAYAEYNASSSKAGASPQRSNSSSKTPRRGGFDPSSTGDEGQAGSTANYSSSRRKSADPPYFPPPPPRPASHQDSSDAPFTEGTRTKTPYSSHIGQQTFSSGDDARRAAGTSQARTTSDAGPQFRSSTRKTGTGTARKPFVIYSSSDDDSETEDDSASISPDTVQANPQAPSADPSDNPSSRPFTRPKKTPNPPSRQFKNAVPFKATGEAVESSNAGPDGFGETAGKDKPTIFTMPINADTFRPNMAKSRSEDNINTSFAPSEWAGAFTSNNVFAAAQSTGRKSATPSRKGSRASRSQPSANNVREAAQQHASTEPVQDPSMQSPPRQPVKFSADEWAKTIKDPSWAFDPQTLRSASPGKPDSRTASRSNSSSTRKSSRVANKIPVNTPKPVTIADEEEENVRTQSPDAMDVDAAPPASTTAPPSAASVQEPRVYPVDTTQLRQDDTGVAEAKFKRESGGFKVRLSDLGAAVESEPSQGLEGLGGISSTLPFPSKASTTIPTKTFTPQTLQLPSLPRAPATPTKLTRTSWSEYCHMFSTYLEKFDKFNSSLLDHFSTRQAGAAKLAKAGVRVLEAVGEASTGNGFMSYAQGVKEDERVREHWNVGCEKHAEAVRAFESVRERVRVLSEGAGLSEV